MRISKYIIFFIVALNVNNALAAHSTSIEIVKLALREKYSEALAKIKGSDNKEITEATVNAVMIYKSTNPPNLTEVKNFFTNITWLPQEMFLKKMERKLTFTTPSDYIITWFVFKEPQSDYGKLLLLHANFEKGLSSRSKNDDVKALRHYWVKTNLDIASEQVFIKKYKTFLTVEDCLRKVERLTWEKKQDYAQRLLNILPSTLQASAQSRIALSKASNISSSLLKPYLKHGAALDEFAQYLYISALFKEKKEKEALEILSTIHNLKHKQSWWSVKNIGVREAMKEKKYQAAYNLTVDHGLGYGAEYAEAEWLGGWIALRYLNNPDLALPRFMNLYANTKLANSRSKGAYWIARVYDASGDRDNEDIWLKTASEYGGTFYGLISLSSLHGEQRINYFNDHAISLFNKDKMLYVRAEKIIATLRLLEEAGGHDIAVAIIKNLPTMEMQGIEYKHIVVAMNRYKMYALSVDLGSIAANSESVLLKEAYPLHIDIDNGALKLPKALYLGIIRQESDFDKNAVSSAGATGLMQLMPGTAERMAKKLGLHKNSYRYDPKANVRTGVAYVNHLYEQYGNIIMTLAAYNAGPGNLSKWIAVYGDPSKFKDEYEIIDWIESIPFKETRNYVKKVFENTVVYDSILSKEHNAKTILSFLKK